MTKSELIARLAEANPHLYQRDVERIVSAIFEEITDALSRGDRVELRVSGRFRSRRAEPELAAIRGLEKLLMLRRNLFRTLRLASNFVRS